MDKTCSIKNVFNFTKYSTDPNMRIHLFFVVYSEHNIRKWISIDQQTVLPSSMNFINKYQHKDILKFGLVIAKLMIPKNYRIFFSFRKIRTSSAQYLKLNKLEIQSNRPKLTKSLVIAGRHRLATTHRLYQKQKTTPHI